MWDASYTVSMEDIREQKAKVLLEAHEAQQEHDRAQQAFAAMIRRIEEFLQTFRGSPEATVARGEAGIPTPHDIITTAKRLVDSRDKLASANKKKSELGLT